MSLDSLTASETLPAPRWPCRRRVREPVQVYLDPAE